MIVNPKYTKKQNEIMNYISKRDWYMLINHGAVRAGKTILNNDLFLMELLRASHNAKLDGRRQAMYILGTTTAGTLQTNVIMEIENRYGIDIKLDRYGNFYLFGVYVVTTATASISGLKSIRGMTAYGAYINEASLANKFVFDEIMKRLSGNGARMIIDTNPEYPSHWLKVNYIDKADGETIIANHFTIFDNNFLSDRFIQNTIKTTPSGPMTDRGIYGLWTAGEGVVYKDFNKETQVISKDQVPDDIEKYVVGVDWGYEHTGVMDVFAIDFFGNWYLIEEHAHQHKHIDEWTDIAKKIQARYGKDTVFWCDSARPEYVDALYYAGINSANANKAVVAGISEVAKLHKVNKFYVVDTAEKWLEEVDRYVWSEKGDVPVKENDDSLDATRYAVYSETASLDSYFE